MPLLPILGEEALCPGQLYPAQGTVSLGSHGFPQRDFRTAFDRILLLPLLGLVMGAQAKPRVKTMLGSLSIYMQLIFPSKWRY